MGKPNSPKRVKILNRKQGGVVKRPLPRTAGGHLGPHGFLFSDMVCRDGESNEV